MRITYYTADWCKPCQSYKPIVEGLKEEYDFELEYVDLTDEHEPGIMSIPTLHIWESDKLTRLVGAYPEDKLREVLDSVR